MEDVDEAPVGSERRYVYIILAFGVPFIFTRPSWAPAIGRYEKKFTKDTDHARLHLLLFCISIVNRHAATDHRFWAANVGACLAQEFVGDGG